MRVAIIGAGLCGLICARTLKQAGYDISVFDKSNHPAGRLSRKVVNGDFVDNGAQYFTARHPDFIGQVGEWLNSGVASQWKAAIGKLTSSAFVESPDTIVRFVGAPTMDSIGNNVAEGLDIKFNKQIKQFKTVSGVHTLFDSNDSMVGEYDWIVFAIPAEQVDVIINLSEGSTGPLFETEDFSNIHAPCWSVRLSFNNPLPMAFDGIFCDDPILKWVAYDSSKPGRNHSAHHYIIHTTPEWTKQNLELTSLEVSHSICNYFLDLIGAEQQPTSVDAHRWRYAIPKEQKQLRQCINHQHKIAIAGDWTLGGKVENAFLSGKAVADIVLNDNLMVTMNTADNP